MPKLSEHKEAEVRQAIRDELAKQPLISSRALTTALEERNIRVDRHYLLKIAKKVQAEISYETQHSPAAAERLKEIRERFRYMTGRLVRIIDWKLEYLTDTPQPTNLDITMAIQTIAKLDLQLFEAEKAAGLYSRKPGEEDAFRRLPIASETREIILRTVRTWGIVLPYSKPETNAPASPARTGNDQ